MNKYAYYSDIADAMLDSEMYGFVFAQCEDCGAILEVEPDATSSFCPDCDEVVYVINPLVEEGLM